MPDSHPDWSSIAGAAAAPNPIALQHLATLGVVPEWTEAVAVVEELCAVLLERGATALVPDPRDVSITAQGTITIRRGAVAVGHADELGRILHDLLGAAATPPPVRLFVAHAIDSGAHANVDEFAQALAYYGRPNRQELISALYERVLMAPGPTDSQVTEPHERPPLESESRRRRPPVLVAVALLSCAVLATVVAVSWNAMDGGAAVSELRRSVTGVTETARSLLRLPAIDPSPAETDAPAAVAPRGPAGGRERASGTASNRSGAFVDAAGAIPSPLGSSVLAAPSVDGAMAAAPALATAGSGPLAPQPDARVYSVSDDDVDPPVLMAPKLPPVPLEQAFAPGTNTMELLVDELGRVEHVRLVTPPVRLSDMTLLSAAKTWLFHPAQKDGRPVKYRLPVSWTVSP